MKKFSRLLGLILALCLLLSLFSSSVLAESAQPLYREEFVLTGGWPPEQIGSWVGYYLNTWGCWTFYRDGRHVLTNFDFPAYNMTGTSKTLYPHNPDFETVFEDGVWYLNDNGKGEFHKVSMPYVRLRAQEEAAVSWIDPELLGTFGGTSNGVYIEWTFHGDGSVTQVTPISETAENGTFFSSGKELAVQINEVFTYCAYRISGDTLLLTAPDGKSRTMDARTGPLVQIPEQWRPDSPRLADAAYREEFAKTGGWPPETIGSWVAPGFSNECGQFSFYPDGRYTQTVFSTPKYNTIGTSKTLAAADKHYVKGDIMHIEANGSSTDARRVSMPYARMKAETETATAGVDPAILGTFGGWFDGLYIEWTFHGDGRLTQVTPLEESTVQGTFLTGDGNLSILLNGKIISYPYKVRASSLSLRYPDAFKVLQKKAGPLVQVPEQWKIK